MQSQQSDGLRFPPAAAALPAMVIGEIYKERFTLADVDAALLALWENGCCCTAIRAGLPSALRLKRLLVDAGRGGEGYPHPVMGERLPIEPVETMLWDCVRFWGKP